MLLVEAGEKTVPAQDGSKAPVSIFVEETGKTGFAHLTNLARSAELAQVNPGDAVELDARGQPPDRDQQRHAHRRRRAAGRRPPAQAHGRRQQVPRRRHLARRPGRPPDHPRGVPGPAQLRQGRFPTAAKSTDLRPYTKGTLVREDEELEDDLEDDIEDEEIENLDRVLPPEETTDEAFVEETDELEEP